MKNRRFLIYLFAFIPLCIMLFFWLQTSGNGLMRNIGISFISLGRLMGLLAVYFTLIQFILRARIMPLERIFGYEWLNKIHKKNGYVVFIFLILHPILLIFGYSITGKIDLLSQFIQFITVFEHVWLAFIGWIIFMLVIFSSIYIVRNKLKYESWYLVHMATYIAVLLSFFHQLSVGTDFIANPGFSYYWYTLYILVFGVTIYTRFISVILRFNKYRFYIDKVVKETDDTISVYIKGENLQSFIFEPGQFLFVRFLSKEYGKESHPFSLSCIPSEKYLRLTVKNEGDFTARLPKIKPGTKVLIDGPHGAFTERFMTRNKIIYIAGGVGITPIRSLIESIGERKEQILFYSNKTTADVVFKNELDVLSQKNKFPIYYVISRDENFKGIKGRIDLKLIKQYVKNLNDYDFYICGPSVMAKSIIKDLKSVSISPSQIHFEEFAL